MEKHSPDTTPAPATVQRLTLRRERLTAEFDPRTGAWVALLDGEEPLLAGGVVGFRVEVEGWTLCDHGFLGSRLTDGAEGPGVERFYRLDFVPADPATAPATPRPPECAVTERVWLAAEGRVERRFTLHCSTDQTAPVRHRLLSATLFFDGLTAGGDDPEISVPMARLRPGTRLAELPETPPGIEASGLDVGQAAVTVATRQRRLILAPRPEESPVKLRVRQHAGRLRVEHEFGCEAWLEPGVKLEIGGQTLHVATDTNWQTALSAFGRSLRDDQGFTPPPDRPAWARGAVVLEVDLMAVGGLRGARERLETWRSLGVNTVYLMPFHTGTFSGYGTSDYEVVDPEKGTLEELRAFTDAAHALGMRVLFDLLMNIAGDDSRYPQQHPDWFYRDAAGTVLRHPVWGGWCLDPAAPGFRRFLLDYAARCVGEWGADGFRVDAVAYRGGNWHGELGLRPHQHSHAVFSLMAELRADIRRINPDAILLAECFGPQQVPISDLVGFQWIGWLDWALSRALSGELTGADFARLLGEHFLALPPDTWLVGYTHTHDTVAFEKRELDGPAVETLFATLTLLTAGTMFFNGGWGVRERPGSKREDGELRTLFFIKKLLGGTTTLEVTFRPSPVPALLFAQRPSRLGRAVIVSNFSGERLPLPESVQDLLPYYSRREHAPSVRGFIEPWDNLVFLPK